MVKQLSDDLWIGKAQCDGSDRRIVKFADGSKLNTTLLLRGEFDLLAINCFAFGGTWRFVFAKNSDLPFSTFKKYTKAQRKLLIASLIPVTWPPEAPFTDNPLPLLDQVVSEKKAAALAFAAKPTVEKLVVSTGKKKGAAKKKAT